MSDRKLLDFNVRAICETCVRHQKALVRTPLIILALGAIVYLFAPRIYRSEACIFLRLGRESVGLDPTATTGQTLALQQADRKDEVKSAIEVMKRRSVIGQAVDKLGADVVLGRENHGFSIISFVTAPLRWPLRLIKCIDPISEREEAIICIERHLYVSAERDSTVIIVQYDATSPKLAQEVCGAVVDSYRHEHTRIHRSEESTPFFAEQQERLRAELDGALERVLTVKNELGISSIAQRRASLEAQFNAVELDRLSTEQELATAQARVTDFEQQIGGTPERLVAEKRNVPNQGADLLRQQLYALEIKVMELKAKYQDSQPLLVAAKEQLADAKRVMAQQVGERAETTDNINTIYRELSLALKRERGVVAGLKSRTAELSRQKEAVVAELRTINSQDLKIDQLSRTADLARDKYIQYSRNIEESRIDKALANEKISNVSVVQPATFAEKPISPSKPLVAVATLVLAIVGAIGIVPATVRWEHFLRELNASVSGGDSGQPAGSRLFDWRRRALPQTAAQTQTPV